MKEPSFESWYAPTRLRLRTLDPLPVNPWLKLSLVLSCLAGVCFIAWQVLK